MWMSANAIYHDLSQRMTALGFFMTKLPSLLVQCNACQVDFGKGVHCFLHVPISVWIDLHGSRDRPTANVYLDLATEPLRFGLQIGCNLHTNQQ